MCSGIQEVVSYICAGFYLKDWRTILCVYIWGLFIQIKICNLILFTNKTNPVKTHLGF